MAHQHQQPANTGATTRATGATTRATAAVERPVRVAILGASGYTGIELLRLLSEHPSVTIAALVADRAAGRPAASVALSLTPLCLPDLVGLEALDVADIDLVFCCLPHATTQEVVRDLPSHLPVIDLSADFRLNDPEVYQAWYGRPHQAPALQAEAAYGLTELNRDAISTCRITACPGCFPTAALLALVPPLRAGCIDPEHLIVDAKTGLSGAGRSLRLQSLLSEAGEGVSAYGLGRHRHMAELEQELSRAAGAPVLCSFTPHLVPMSRGELITAHLRGEAEAVRSVLTECYRDEPFVHVLAPDQVADTISVRATNHCLISVHSDRRPGHVIVLAAIDNLTKGSSGQAVQNMNLRLGWPETMGLPRVAVFP